MAVKQEEETEKKEEVAAAKKKRSPKKKAAAVEPAAEGSDPEAAASSTKSPSKKEKSPKPLSNLARKKADARYILNGKGRYVSKAKSENGKKNVQSRAIKMARTMLGLSGRMVLLGKEAEGKALLDLCGSIRESLKGGKSDSEAEALHADLAKKLVEGFAK